MANFPVRGCVAMCTCSTDPILLLSQLLQKQEKALIPVSHYPLLIFPLQGKIACANVLSDLYAMGVSECDNMLMLLGVSEQLKPKERQVVTPLVIQGFTGE